MRLARRAIAIGTVVLALSSFPLEAGASRISAGKSAGSSEVDGAVAADADWIMKAQLPGGAICSHVDQTFVNPYLANYAAIGLARAAAQTGRATYADAAWKWLAWYGSHQDGQGFVQDYTVSSGLLRATGDMDSTDAYAGTFLTAAWEAWQVKQSLYLGRLAKLKPAINAAVGAIEATMDVDGLTWAKPTWHVKYAMDQAEAYAGLLAAGAMAAGLGDRLLADRARGDARRLAAGFDRLWNEATEGYDWALHADGTRQSADWSILYPDALGEVWVASFGLTDPWRAAVMMGRFASAQPNWDQPTGTARFGGEQVHFDTVGYWPVAGWGFVKVGDTGRASLAAQHIRTAALAADRAWPFTSATAGELIVLQTSGALPAT
jgi:hypothetical protein